MTQDVITVAPETDIAYAAKLLLENHINGIAVVDPSRRLVGILCQSDLIVQQKKFPVPSIFTLLDGFFPLTSLKQLQQEAQKIAATKVSHAMTPDPVTVSPDMSIEQIADLMVDKKFGTLPVVDADNKLVGIVGKEDLLKMLLEKP
ncbi:MAG: CBS domain-containing protein [Desulfobacterales bacterium]|nr:CBS domain-containing protein [Desulfobacterales bacterium]MDD4071709.1 CBS domain-containing protein [Desulfobacterales bacterium]